MLTSFPVHLYPSLPPVHIEQRAGLAPQSVPCTCRDSNFRPLSLRTTLSQIFVLFKVCLQRFTVQISTHFLSVYYARNTIGVRACGLSVCTIFFKLFHKRHDLGGGGGAVEHKLCVLFFSTTFVLEISHSTTQARYYHKCTHVFLQITSYSFQILLKT